MSKSKITSHILDTELGKPAQGVQISLEKLEGNDWIDFEKGETDSDGRVIDWIENEVVSGCYRISFDVESYFKKVDENHFILM